MADKTVKTIQEIKLNRTKGDNTPFFLATGFHKPHLPFYALSKYYDMYPPADEIPLLKNPDAPAGIPLISWFVSGAIGIWKNINYWNVTAMRML